MVVIENKLVDFNMGKLKKGASRLALLTAMLAVAGCSSPDWVNPTNWFEEDNAPVPIENSAPTADGVKSDEGGEYPKLGSTPAVPGKTISIEEADTIENGLKADRDNAQYTDQKLRADTAIQPMPKPKPVVVEPAAPAEAPATGPAVAPVPAAPVAAAPLGAPAPVTAPQIPTPTQTSNGVKLMPNAAPITTPEQAYARQVPASNTVVISGNGVEDVFQKQLAASAATTTTLPASTQFQSYPVTPLNNSAVSVAPIIQDTYNQPVALGYGNTAGTPQMQTGVAIAGDADAIIYFEVGSSRVGAGDMGKIRKIAAAQASTGGVVKVVGHASSRTRELPLDRHMMVNLRMSQERATNVVKALIGQGVASQNIVVESQSDSNPVTREAMPSDEAKNRRVEIFLVN